MEPFIVRFGNTALLAIVGFFLIQPVIHNRLEGFGRIESSLYKVSSAILIFSFATNMADLIFGLGTSYFYFSSAISWTAVVYGIAFWVKALHIYDVK